MLRRWSGLRLVVRFMRGVRGCCEVREGGEDEGEREGKVFIC